MHMSNILKAKALEAEIHSQKTISVIVNLLNKVAVQDPTVQVICIFSFDQSPVDMHEYHAVQNFKTSYFHKFLQSKGMH